MAITNLNDYSIGDSNLNGIMTSLDKTYKGKAEMSISNYSTTAAPVIKVGSVFENNGALYIIDTSDITPTGYAGIANSTTFYIVYDESEGEFVYSSVAPTWSDSKQGWYSGNDRYFFSMYKDSGGTLYQDKAFLKQRSPVVKADTVSQKTTGSGVSIGSLFKPLYGIKPSGSIHGDNVTEDTIFDALDTIIPDNTDVIIVNGAIINAVTNHNAAISRIVRATSTTMTVYYLDSDGDSGTYTLTNGGATQYNISIAW